MRPPGEDLLGYLLDALEEPDRQQVHDALAQDESLQHQLEDLRRVIGFLEPARQMAEPPPGLAERTCRWIAAVTSGLPDRRIEESTAEGQQVGLPASGGSFAWSVLGPQVVDSASPVQPSQQNPWGAGLSGSQQAATQSSQTRSSPKQVGLPLGARGSEDFARLAGRPTAWRWPDLVVAAAVSILLVLVLFGAIHYSRLRQEITQCQENLRRLGGGLIQYSDFHREQFPPIPTQGPMAVAGMYGPVLITGGFVQDQQAFWCPGAVRQGMTPIPIPNLAQLERLSAQQREAILPRLGGAYGYSLGYIEAGQYCPTRNRHRSYFAVLADAPSPEHPQRQSFHHGGGGQNVFFEDGHVEFVCGYCLPVSQDHFFLNHQGVLAPGIGPDDAVVAPATARPSLPTACQQTQ